MTSKPDTWSSIHKKTYPNELVVIKKLEKFERISLWSKIPIGVKPLFIAFFFNLILLNYAL